jgi:hypothetical protein
MVVDGNLSCASGVINSDTYDVVPSVVLPFVFGLLILAPFFRWRGKRLRLMKPNRRDKLEENEAAIHKEILLAAVLYSVVSVYGVVETSLDAAGIQIGLDATLLTELLVGAWVAALGSLQDNAPAPRMLVGVANATDASADFLAPALRVYVTVARAATLLELVCAIALVVAAVTLKRRPQKAFLARAIVFGAWLLSVVSSLISLLVPYSQMVPFPSCPDLQPTADAVVCATVDLQLLFVLEKQIVGVVFGLISLLGALPYVVFVVPVWVRCAKLIVGQRRDIGQILYFGSFIIFFSLVSFAGIASLLQALGLYSISTSMQIIWVLSSVHLTPLSSYKNWFHFVCPFYGSMILMVIWFSLVTPLGCVMLTFFSTTSGAQWFLLLTRVLSVAVRVVHFVASIFLTNAGVWFFFEVSIARATRMKGSSEDNAPLIDKPE